MTKSIDAFILAGGNSSRMGFDKASLKLGGVAVIEQIARALTGIADYVYIAGGSGEIAGVRRIPDLVAAADGRSSLAGLYSALRHASSDWIAVAACDMPFVTTELFGILASRRFEGGDAVIPHDRFGSVQPLCGLYRVEPCAEACRIAMEGADLSLRGILRRVDTKWVDFDDIAHLPHSEILFFNLNTPDDVAAAEKMLAAGIRP